ncbi:hypothetical protein Ga0080559_TMP1452 [Salipiger profundus]|uniref:Uncharacterized protein n=1 Tax=Salipiger profundus TaxID=1229727 RepID=A0A1U7D2B7_9RHOB|nr:hypothetical protein Ga0080559_TMP1452 [Salipiger profundus]
MSQHCKLSAARAVAQSLNDQDGHDEGECCEQKPGLGRCESHRVTTGRAPRPQMVACASRRPLAGIAGRPSV